MADELLHHASALNDNRLLRMHLIVEEASEVCLALTEQNEVQLLDGLADLYYVTLGTAVSYCLPLSEAFWEVHRSNMTKRAGAQRDGLGQDRVDGNNTKEAPGFVPANIEGLLSGYRYQHISAIFERDGDKWTAKRNDFDDLHTSYCGFGDTPAEALKDLERQEQAGKGVWNGV